MSASAARRRKQLLQKKLTREKAEQDGESTTDPNLLRLNSLLQASDETAQISEEAAYEALQLAQYQVRRYEKMNEVEKAIELCYLTSITLLKKAKVSVASQLILLLSDVIVETFTLCNEKMVEWILNIDTTYRDALSSAFANLEKETDKEEEERLSRLHYKFLRRVVRWSAEYGPVSYGDYRLHTVLAEQCWRMNVKYHPHLAEMKDDEYDDVTVLQEVCAEVMIHLALAEKPDRIFEILKSLPGPTPEQEKTGRDGGTACERDCLFTRAILVFIAVENLRDANALLHDYVTLEPMRDNIDTLAKSYMDKTDGKAPTHAMFCNMLLQICEKDRAGPLYTWLLRSFNADLTKMKPDVKAYTTKIGRVYFNIQPPPSMMNMMETMMGGMGAMGGMAPPMQQPPAKGRR